MKESTTTTTTTTTTTLLRKLRYFSAGQEFRSFLSIQRERERERESVDEVNP